MRFCYKRVSTAEQNIDRQLHGESFDREFVEKVSGKDANRPELLSMLSSLRSGDEVHVHELSRLARNTKDLLSIVEKVLGKGANISFHKEGLHFMAGEKPPPVQDLMLSLLGAIAQFERDLILERQREGIALAKHRGAYKGRQSRFSSNQIDKIKSEFIHAQNKAKLAKKQKGKGKEAELSEAQLAARQAQEEKLQRDQALNEQRKQEADKKAIAAQVTQMIQHYKVSRKGGEVEYHFTDTSKVKKILVPQSAYDEIVRGRLCIARVNDSYELIPKPVAEKIQERDTDTIVVSNEKPNKTNASATQANTEQGSDKGNNNESSVQSDDDYYAQFEIPDDLTW